MIPYVQKPRPLIAARIEYALAPGPPLPSITPRVEFTAERLAYSQTLAAANIPVEQEDGEDGPRGQGGGPSGPVAGPSNAESSTRSSRSRSSSSKIPKPSGEPGRPGSGGFCIDDVLVKTHGWSAESVAKLTGAIRSEARKQLNVTISYRAQNKAVVQKICDKMMENDRWPGLKDYENCWPVHSILKLALKYSTEASRRASAKEDIRRMRAAMRGSSPEV